MLSVPAAEFDFGSHAKKQCESVSNLMFARCNWAFVETVEPEIELPKLYELFVTKFRIKCERPSNSRKLVVQLLYKQ